MHDEWDSFRPAGMWRGIWIDSAWSGPFLPLIACLLVLNGAQVVPGGAVRAVFVLPCILLAPGYAVTLLVFGLRRTLDLKLLIPLSIMLSIAFLALLGIALHFLLFPLTSQSILLGTDVALCAIAIVAWRLNEHGTPVGGLHGLAPRPRAALLFRRAWLGALLAATGFVCVFIVVAGEKLLPAPPAQAYTQFYFNGSWAHLDGVVYATHNTPLTITVSIANQTPSTRLYHLVPQVDGIQAWGSNWATLASGHKWDGIVHALVPADARLHRVAIDLKFGRQKRSVAELVFWAYSSDHPGQTCPCGL